MGNWHISIQGVGPHHNAGYDGDADRMAAELVRELDAKGHRIESATFTYGGRDDIRKPEERQ